MATSSRAISVETPDGRVVATQPIHCTLYRRGVIAKGFAYDGPRGGGRRGVIGDFSDRSRHKFCFDLDNAPMAWGAMTLLSYRVQPDAPKKHLEAFVRRVKIEWGEVDYAWYMETQPREESGGDPTTHFHWYWTQPFIRALLKNGSHHIATLGRGDKARPVLRGPLDDFIAATWTRLVDDPSPKHARYQAGGRTEPIRDSGKAAWYAASEAGKRRQKQLPPGVRSLGRWCYISPGQRKIPVGVAERHEWPLDYPCSHIYDHSWLGAEGWREVGTGLPISPEFIPRPTRKGGE